MSQVVLGLLLLAGFLPYILLTLGLIIGGTILVYYTYQKKIFLTHKINLIHWFLICILSSVIGRLISGFIFSINGLVIQFIINNLYLHLDINEYNTIGMILGTIIIPFLGILCLILYTKYSFKKRDLLHTIGAIALVHIISSIVLPIGFYKIAPQLTLRGDGLFNGMNTSNSNKSNSDNGDPYKFFGNALDSIK